MRVADSNTVYVVSVSGPKMYDLQQQWERQVQKIRTNVTEKREEHDAKFAAMQADVAEADAEFAVAIAQAAIEEAEYAALEAVLARGKATELAATR